MVGQHEYVFAAMSGRRPLYPMWFDVARQAYVRLMVWASLCFWVLACTCFLLMFELSELAFICFVLMFERHKTDIDYNIFRCRYPWRATRARKIDKGIIDVGIERGVDLLGLLRQGKSNKLPSVRNNKLISQGKDIIFSSLTLILMFFTCKCVIVLLREKKKQQVESQDHQLAKLKNSNEQRLITDSSENNIHLTESE
ncbi:hypothetical protein Tco_1371020 [Tanacetum coccineum]